MDNPPPKSNKWKPHKKKQRSAQSRKAANCGLADSGAAAEVTKGNIEARSGWKFEDRAAAAARGDIAFVW
ncbi:hypothetical protein HPP92_027987 [Vanilla planifolia]|uniref:Uncharacterized protein n=1 Tax=Vanilla planifolia TaxID=51239 RepID=A0A835PCV8_VANPL|nr:hypothetical protein HPP92_027987 [Vanilla planifolia]